MSEDQKGFIQSGHRAVETELLPDQLWRWQQRAEWCLATAEGFHTRTGFLSFHPSDTDEYKWGVIDEEIARDQSDSAK